VTGQEDWAVVDRYLSRAPKTTRADIDKLVAELTADKELSSTALAARVGMKAETVRGLRRLLEEAGCVERAETIRGTHGKTMPRRVPVPAVPEAPPSAAADAGLERLTIRSARKGPAASRNGAGVVNRLYYYQRNRPLHSLGQQLERLTSLLAGQLGGLDGCDFSSLAGDARCARWAEMLSQAKGHLSRIRRQLVGVKEGA
jgi:hypothetical protein